MTDIIERLEDAIITTSARARDVHDTEVYSALLDASEEIQKLRIKKKEMSMQAIADICRLQENLEEIQRLKDKCDKLATMLRRVFPEKFSGTYFICGEAGEKDSNGMPKNIFVAPAFGVDFSYEYVYNGKVSGPEW